MNIAALLQNAMICIYFTLYPMYIYAIISHIYAIIFKILQDTWRAFDHKADLPLVLSLFDQLSLNMFSSNIMDYDEIIDDEDENNANI